ncbi:ribosomal protein S18-alanine N-acetyltransferase [Enterococcus bulliens]
MMIEEAMNMSVAESRRVYALASACFSHAPWTAEQFYTENQLQYSHTLLVKKDADMIGFLVYQELAGQAEILLIGVLPAYRKQKIATVLLEKMFEQSEVTEYFLEVRASNQAAYRLYQAHGFEHYHTRRSYYQQPVEDAYLLKKKVGTNQ